MILFTDQLIDETITLVNEWQREVALALGQTVAAEVPASVNKNAPRLTLASGAAGCATAVARIISQPSL